MPIQRAVLTGQLPTCSIKLVGQRPSSDRMNRRHRVWLYGHQGLLASFIQRPLTRNADALRAEGMGMRSSERVRGDAVRGLAS